MTEATTEIEIREPATKVRKVSKARLDTAARELKLLSISSTRLSSVATIGQFLDELGVLKYGNGRLLGSAQAMAEGAFYCAKMARKKNLDDETRQGYLELQLRFVKALDENVVMQLKVNKASETVGGMNLAQAKSFLPGASISPVQINISPNATVTETKEQPCKT